jgi:hypothetical protein
MLAAIAAVVFGIAFVINAAGIATDAVFAPFSCCWSAWLCSPSIAPARGQHCRPIGAGAAKLARLSA